MMPWLAAWAAHPEPLAGLAPACHFLAGLHAQLGGVARGRPAGRGRAGTRRAQPLCESLSYPASSAGLWGIQCIKIPPAGPGGPGCPASSALTTSCPYCCQSDRPKTQTWSRHHAA